MNRKALGKGIKALIPEFEMGVPEVGLSSAKDLSVDEISPNRMQARSFFDDKKLEELVASIEEYGILQPVVVQKANFLLVKQFLNQKESISMVRFDLFLI